MGTQIVENEFMSAFKIHRKVYHLAGNMLTIQTIAEANV